jgi:ubiquinone/menaquinone biosynthesis C-methylase UbiE
MTDRYQNIYANEASTYDELVRVEDTDGHVKEAVLAALRDARRVVDVGAGTGRVTRWLLDAGKEVVAVEPVEGMRTIGAAALPKAVWHPGEASALPLPDHSVDAAVEGWAFGHVMASDPANWESRSRAFIAELRRVVRPGGVVVLIETAGTCVDQAAPPPHLLPLYALWQSLGFVSRDLSSDYRFSSADEAARVMGAFFGESMATRVRARGLARVPEFTRVFTGVTAS